MAQIKYRRVALLANLPATSLLDGDVYFVRENSGWYVWDAVNLAMKAVGSSAGLPSGSGNKVLATPADGSSAVASLRALVALDIPNLPSTKITGLAAVATSGSYTDLSNKPTIPAAQVQTDWNAVAGLGVLLNKPTLATVATTGSYTDLSNKPTLPVTLAAGSHQFLTSYNSITGAFTQAQPAYSDISETPTLATVATTGAYSDLTGKPTLAGTIAAVSHQFLTSYNSATGAFTQAQPAYADISGTPTLATVATTGAYSDLTGKPTIPTSFTWDVEGNAAGNLSINNAGFTSTFNQTSAVAWLWANTTIATISSTNASPLLELAANYWTAGSASAQDLWTLGSSLAAGANGVSTLALLHSGSTGYAVLTAPNIFAPTNVGAQNIAVTNGSDPTTAAVTAIFFSVSSNCMSCTSATVIGWGTQAKASSKSFDVGISRLSSGVLAIGNGTAADYTGGLQLGALSQVNGTVASAITTNLSPLQTYQANYWTGAASAADTWTIGSSLAAGTNGKSLLNITHAGSSGNAYLNVAAITSPGSLTFDVNVNGGSISFTQQRGTTNVGGISFGTGGGVEGMQLAMTSQGGTLSLAANFVAHSSATAGCSGIVTHLGNNASNLTATSGNLIACDIGSSGGGALGDLGTGFTFAATATSSAVITGLRIAPTINVGAGVSWTGSATILLVNPTLTATGSGTPIINLMDLQVGSVSKLTVDKTGTVKNYNGITTVDNGVPSEIGHIDTLAKAAALVATTLVTPAANGRFRISIYAQVTVAATTSCTLGAFTLTYTDGTAAGAAQSLTVPMQNPAGTMVLSSTTNTTANVLVGEVFIYAKSGVAVQLAVAYTSVGATPMQYELHATAEAM